MKLRMNNPIKQIAAKTRTEASVDERSGFVLVSLLIVATVGILFGFGRLLLYRYQCQLRIQRQHELEKVYAIRSAVRWIEVQTVKALNAIDGAEQFNVDTPSGRSLGVEVRPVSPIYPATENHFQISNKGHYDRGNVDLFGEDEMYPVWDEKGSAGTPCGVIGPGSNVVGKVGRIVANMGDTGSWLGDTYGRRYMVNVSSINTSIGATNRGDTLRLYIVPAETKSGDVANSLTPAIGLSHIPLGKEEVHSVMAWYRLNGSNVVLTSAVEGFQNVNAKGFQLAGNNICLFNAEYLAKAVAVGAYKFSDIVKIPDEVIAAFIDENGAPKELKMVLEVEQSGPAWDGTAEKRNKFDKFQVLPAYEFEVALTWSDRRNVVHSEVATVLHLDPSDRSVPGKAYTYDTHGVEKRGYE